MLKNRLLFMTLLILNTSCLTAQINDNDSIIDQLSRRLVHALKQNSFENLRTYFPVYEDFKYILSLAEDSMSNNEYENAKAMLDTLPFMFKSRMQKKFDRALQRAREYAIDWKTIEYLDTKIDYQQEKTIPLQVAEVSVIFGFKDEKYIIKFECGQLPKGWIIGNDVQLMKILREDD